MNNLNKYKVTLYQETYTEYEIEAGSQEAANEIVLSGQTTEDDICDVVTKHYEIINNYANI
jgi:hypothetical protein